MKFTVEVETDCRVHPAKAPARPRPALTWDIKVSVEEARLISEPPPEPKKVSFSGAPAPRASEPPPIHRVMESVSELPTPPAATRTVEVMNASKKKSTITISKKQSVSTDSSATLDAERKLSKLMNTRGRKVTRQGDWIVFTEKVGILTSQNGVQQTREQRVKINSEDFARLTTLGF